MARKKKNFIDEALDLDEKQAPSDKIFSIISLSTSIVAAVILVVCLLFYIAQSPIALPVWYYLFYPCLILAIVGASCSAGQLIRNHYFSTIFALILSGLTIIALVVVLIIQGVVYNGPFIGPFFFL